MKTTQRSAIRLLGAAGMALTFALAGPAKAEVRVDPNRDESKGIKFLSTGDVPYIDFTTLDGEVITNESLKGKLVVIDVWATWCAPCMAAMPHFKSLVEDYGGSDSVVFLGVSMDSSRETLDKTIQESGITWKQVYDADRNLNLAWNQGMIPTIAIIAPTGESVYVGHPSGMDAPLQEALKKYAPDVYSDEKAAAYLAKADEEAKAREAEMARQRAEYEAQATAAYKPGSHPLPELNLVDIDGNPITADSLKGKVVIMDFWATWCGPCMASMPHMKELYAKHHETDNVEVIGISRDRDEATLRKTKDEVGMPWLHVYDQDASISKKFNVTGIPQIFIFSRTGEMLWAGHPVQMDEPLAKILADDTLTAAAFARKDDGERKSIPAMTKTPAMTAAQVKLDEQPKMTPAAVIKPMPAPAQPQEPRVPLEIGAKPEFTLSFVDGKQVTHEDLKGKIVVMDFWATWCGPCMAAMPHMIQLQKEYGDKGVQIVGISLDKSMDTLKQALADKPDMSWPQHYDPDRVITKQFGVSGIPTIYILSPEGEVLWYGHPNEMDAPLKQALANHPPAVARAD